MIFFFNDTAPTEIYPLSLHDALPICQELVVRRVQLRLDAVHAERGDLTAEDRKSTRLNSSHSQISYAVFCLKKKITPSPLPCWTVNSWTRPTALSSVRLVRRDSYDRG